MPAIVPWKLGQHLTAFTFTPLVMNASTGALTAASSAYNIRGILERAPLQNQRQVASIRPLAVVQEHEVPISRGSRLQLHALRQSNVGSPLAVCWHNGILFAYVTWVEGTETRDFYGSIQNVTEGMDGHGQQTDVMDLGPIALSDREQVTYTTTVAP